MLKKGLVEIYTGDGKGKTTAAFGLALRAAGWGHKVLIYQFLKPSTLEIGERFAIERSTIRIRVETLDIDWDMARSLDDPEHRGRARQAITQALERLGETAQSAFYDVVILDEIVFCQAAGLVDIQDIRRLIERRAPTVELVLTGRGATQALIDLADLVTEMRPVKHPFEAGPGPRRGIEY
ncbi:MAG TPA: cob(I)yrinic acid a,c-diamide adenosyltransferase [Phycisphaerales bacterium]|nr:cob(I)yrinic acid a,c-diamide adenosyltransferase [Phycisphaerales bacterium]